MTKLVEIFGGRKKSITVYSAVVTWQCFILAIFTQLVSVGLIGKENQIILELALIHDSENH